MRDVDALAEPDALVERLVAERRVAPPTIGQRRPTGQPSGPFRPTETPGRSAPTTRQYVHFPVEGDIEALNHWPDQYDGDTELRAVDEGLSFLDRSPGAPWDYAAALEDHEAHAAMERWIVAGDQDSRYERGLHTFVEYLDEDIDQVTSGEIDLGAMVDVELDRIRPLVAAIDAQHRDFFDRELPEAIHDAVQRRRRRLEGLAAAQASIGFPADWKAPEPQLANDEPATSEPTRSESSTAAPTEGSVGLPSGPTRFDDASFEQVLQTVRVWADAVEQYPEAYRKLIEDRISDLLVVTLNTALPGAKREVFSRGGKTDIFIQADALPRGTAPVRVFIGENKKYDGPSKANDALDQLLGYLQVRRTSAMLILLIDRADPERARTEALQELANRPDYLEEVTTPVDGWPVLRFRRDEGDVEVCIATINISRPREYPTAGTQSEGGRGNTGAG